MTSKSLIAISTLVVALAAVPASALDISIAASGGGSASSGDGSAETSASIGASVSAESDTYAHSSAAANGTVGASIEASSDDSDPLDEVIDLIRKSAWATTSFSSTSELDATAYDLGAWVNGSNSTEFEAALADNADEIAELHYALEANAEFSAWLDSEHTDASSVVAVGMAADGSLAVFTYNN